MIGNILPYNDSEAIILETAKRLNLPGSNGGLIDARPGIKKLLRELYANGYCLTSLGGDGARAAAATLTSGQKVVV